MTIGRDAEIGLRCQRLQNDYALALDGRDRDALRAVFHPDASFALYRPDEVEPYGVIEGHDQLAGIVDGLRDRYAKTMHVMTNHVSTVHGNDATGSVYCVAHHLIVDGGALREFVAHLHYVDTFRCGADGAWRISRREVRFQWSAEHPVLSWDEGAVRGRLS